MMTWGDTPRLADYLEAGVPLGLALARSRNSFPSAVRLAAELGQQTGDSDRPCGRRSARAMNRMPCSAPAAEKATYLSLVVMFGVLLRTALSSSSRSCRPL